MKNKGFTLIELLAVIVILAIIALIATPIILGIINDARAQAKQRTAELIGKEAQLAYTSFMFDTNAENEPTDSCEYMKPKYFAMDNATITTPCDGGTTKITVGKDEYTATYANGVMTVTGDSGVKAVTVKIATK